MIAVSTSSCQFLLQTIEDVFDLSKIELNQFYLNFDWLSLTETFKETSKILEIQFKQKGVKLEFRNETQVSCEFFSDQKRLKQIFFNLIVNALKFTQKGYVRVSIFE